MGNIRKYMEKDWTLTTRGFRATRNAISDNAGLIRELIHEVSTLKTMLHDNKAISAHLPHGDLLQYIPFKTDEDVRTVLRNPDLNNALYSKVFL